MISYNTQPLVWRLQTYIPDHVLDFLDESWVPCLKPRGRRSYNTYLIISTNSLYEVMNIPDHVLDSLDGGRVHGLDPPLWGEPLVLTVVINNLYNQELIND